MHKYKFIPNDEIIKKKLLERYEEKDGCWNWTGTLMLTGYGCIRYNLGPRKNTVFLAHRASYKLLGGGELIDGMAIDHMCSNRRCINPEHLQQLTIERNAQKVKFEKKARMGGGKYITYFGLFFRGVCKHGHVITSLDKVYVANKNNAGRGFAFLICRECMLVSKEKQWKKKLGIG
jgi:hypothetical protein